MNVLLLSIYSNLSSYLNVNSRKPFLWFSKSARNYKMVLLIAPSDIALVINLLEINDSCLESCRRNCTRKTFFKNFEILWTGFVDLNIVENCKQYCGRYKYVNFQYSAFDDVLRNFTESPVSECDINRTENLPCCLKIAFQSDYFE
ncbi:conserved hypothetical protein [Trichinella spiralis]|uniref:hypothetical protein n=1 Tax=Trichinella spiralis TaxID=6334 RepID=UPI0001EFED41|nr:conserved hypothetical protein [Trichinella spiralis]